MKSINALARITVFIGLFNFAITAAQAQVVLTMANSNTTTYEDFSNATYSGSLEGINLSGDWLNFANLASADLVYADLTSADLSYADFSGVDLTSANLSGAGLFYTNLASANLTSANLTSANLSGAGLFYTILASANLTSANLTSANLSFATFLGADLTEVTGLNSTSFSADQAPTYDGLTNFTGTSFDPVAAGWTLTGGASASVPEPSTYAAIFGAVALGFAAYKRRRAG